MKQETLLYLEKEGRNIKAEADKGNKIAKDIISYYTMHYQVPGDQAALTFLEEAIKEYKNKENSS